MNTFTQTESFSSFFKNKEITAEQSDIFYTIQKGIGNVCIKAVAGSGKSTVAIGSIFLLPNSASILVLAHNKTVANHLRTSLSEGGKDMSKVKVMTFHSYGFRLLESTNIIDFKKAKKTEDSNSPNDKYAKYIRENINNLSSTYKNLSASQKLKYKNNIKKLVEYAQLNLKQSYNEIIEIAALYGITLISDEPDCVLKVLKWGQTEGITQFSYPDYLWLPSELNIRVPSYLKFDYVFVDEAQDMSPAQQNLVKKAVHRTTRIIMMGDDHQAINMWCGAEINAMDKLKKRFPSALWHNMTLTTNYRCGKNIIAYTNAKNILNGLNFCITPFEKAPKGDVIIGGHLNEIKNGDLVLCRMTAPLMELFLKFKKEGKTVALKGEGIEISLRDFLLNINFDNIDDIYNEAYNSFTELKNKAIAQFNCNEKDALKIKDVLDSCQLLKIIESMKSYAISKQEMLQIIDDSLKNIDIGNCITLSTIHRAKGDESKNVFIICPSLMPSPFMNPNNLQDVYEEKNLQYVALTRAKENLIFVDEQEIKPFTTIFKKSI